MSVYSFSRVQRQYYIYKELLDVTEDRNYEFKAGGMLLQRHTLIPVCFELPLVMKLDLNSI